MNVCTQKIWHCTTLHMLLKEMSTLHYTFILHVLFLHLIKSQYIFADKGMHIECRGIPMQYLKGTLTRTHNPRLFRKFSASGEWSSVFTLTFSYPHTSSSLHDQALTDCFKARVQKPPKSMPRAMDCKVPLQPCSKRTAARLAPPETEHTDSISL